MERHLIDGYLGKRNMYDADEVDEEIKKLKLQNATLFKNVIELQNKEIQHLKKEKCLKEFIENEMNVTILWDKKNKMYKISSPIPK